MTDPITLTLPFPPSINGYWRAHNGRNILSKRGREYRREAVAEAVGSPAWNMDAREGRLQVSLHLHPPDRRRRDADNYTKGVLDALTHAGVWLDDEQIDDLHILKCPPDRENPRVEVTISTITLTPDGQE